MDFLSSLILLASGYGISEEEVRTMHNNYCQNLYWQENAEEKLNRFECDIYKVENEIARVKSGK